METEALDKAVALFLMRPSSHNALEIVRATRRISLLEDDHGPNIQGLMRDASALYRSAIIMESDPEIIKRNTLARVLAGLGPVLSGWEEIKTLEDRRWDEILMSVGSVVSEVASSTQYLETARLTTRLHFKEELFGIEERMIRLAREHGGADKEKLGSIEGYIDGIMEKVDVPREKPLLVFSLATVIMVISYRLYKENIRS